MAAFVPVDGQVEITDGTAAPGTPAAPASIRDFTEFYRGGGEFSVANMSFQRGGLGRAADEHGYLRRLAVGIADLSVEWDEQASNGTAILFDMADARTANQRVYRRTYRSGFTRSVLCLVTNVSDAYSDDEVMLANISLQATGPLTEVGW